MAHKMQGLRPSAIFDYFEFERTRNMRRILTVCAVAAIFSALALAETFTGRLIDASCYEQQKSASTCEPTASTTSFALDVAGKVYMFDANGNTKAAEAWKARAGGNERGGGGAEGSAQRSARVMAKVSGTKDGDNTITVDTIEIR
jgi:hypothetical protein